jgi:hypothetical protein
MSYAHVQSIKCECDHVCTWCENRGGWWVVGCARLSASRLSHQALSPGQARGGQGPMACARNVDSAALEWRAAG